jgi:hypothetical protein
MLNWITNILWKNQNFLGKVQLVVITVLVGVIYYYKAYLGIYKHKYVSGLETDKIELLQEVEDIKFQKTTNRSRIRINTKNLQSDKDKIEQKRKQDEEAINNTTVTNKQRSVFISKYEKR